MTGGGRRFQYPVVMSPLSRSVHCGGICLLICWLLCGAGGKAEEVKLPPLWNEYRTIMWIGDSAYRKPEKFPLFLSRLREMGINTAMVYGDGDPRPLVEARFPYYVENIVNKGLCLKWNSKVRDWDGFVTAWAKALVCS